MESDSAKENTMSNNDQLRTKSLTSIGFPTKSIIEDSENDSASDKSKDGQPVDDDGQATFDVNCLDAENHYIPKDVICFIIICEQHQRIALEQLMNYYFFPSVQFDMKNQSMADLTRIVVEMLIRNTSCLNDDAPQLLRLQLIDLYRVKIPKTGQFIQRFIFKTILDPNPAFDSGKNQLESGKTASDSVCICNNATPDKTNSEDGENKKPEEIIWVPILSLANNFDTLWGGELVLYFCNPSQGKNLLNCFTFTELDHRYSDRLLATSCARITNGTISNLSTNALFLFNEFVVQCFPSSSMSFASFCILCDKLGWVINLEARKMFFRSFDRQCRNFIDFSDLLHGLILFDSTNETTDIVHRHDYIFRYYDANMDSRLEFNEYRQLFHDFFNFNNIESLLKKESKSKDNFTNELIDKTWNTLVEQNSEANMSFEQYLKAFECMNQNIGSRSSWLPMMSFFDQIALKFNCRNRPVTTLQKLADRNIYFNRCDSCLNKRFNLSSSLVHLSEVGNIIKVFRFRPNPDVSLISFIDEFQEKNIFGLANEFMIRIEKIGYNLLEHNGILAIEQDDEDMAKNYFFPNRQKMLKYLHLILEFAKKLFENDLKIVEVSSPAYVIGDLNGSLKDLLHFSQTVFRTFPFIDSATLLFLGNYTDSESTYNLECLIYLICMKILSPGRVYLLRGLNEMCGRQQISMQDKDMPDEPLNDVICNLIAQIFELFPVASVVDDKIFATHSGIPKNIVSLYELRTIAVWHLMATNFQATKQCLPSKSPNKSASNTTASSSRSSSSSSSFNNIYSSYYNYHQNRKQSTNGDKSSVDSSDPQSMSSIDAVHLQNLFPIIDELMDEVSQLIIYEPLIGGISEETSDYLFSMENLEHFLKFNQLFALIRSHCENNCDKGYRIDYGCNMATVVSSNKGSRTPSCVFIDRSRIRLIRFDANG